MHRYLVNRRELGESVGQASGLPRDKPEACPTAEPEALTQP